MAVPTLEELFTPLTPDEVEAKLLQIAETLEFPVTAWAPLDAMAVLLAIVAANDSNLTQTMTLMGRSGLLDFAANTDGTINPWLTVLADSVYDVQREEETFATTPSMVLTNAAAVPYSISPGDLTFAITTGPNAGATFHNTTGGVLPASGGALGLTIVADTSGSGSTAQPGFITTMVTPLAGVSATNTLAAIGLDAESDQKLIQRCRAKLGALSPNGPSKAYEFAALSTINPTTGAPVDINRVSVSPFSSTGQVQVYVASTSGPVPGTVGDLTTDLGLVAQNIFENAMPIAVTVTVNSAASLSVLVRATIYMRDSNTILAADVQTAVLQRLLAFFQRQPVGGTNIGAGGRLFLDAIIGEIYATVPNQVAQVIISSPVADVVMTASQVAVLTSVTTDFTVVQL
jgi:phage-related baseplate assembly protein